MSDNKINYPGWELKYFDKATNFRNYQFNLFKKYLKKNICEIGPGNGVMTSRYYDLSKKITLFEPTEKIFRKIKKKFKNKKNIKIYNTILKSKRENFDNILYLDVIEHIKDPIKELKKSIKMVNSKGSVIINLPAFNHLYSQFDKDIGHVCRYSKGDFIKIINKLNLNNRFKYKLIYYDSVGYFLSFFSKLTMNNYKKKFSQKIMLWNFLIRLSILFDKIILNSFGKSLLVIIYKK
tara:strand:+ start:48 stop:755 length:708 start_codon:yes stop_codon:yes gene_type:complete